MRTQKGKKLGMLATGDVSRRTAPWLNRGRKNKEEKHNRRGGEISDRRAFKADRRVTKGQKRRARGNEQKPWGNPHP